MDDIDDILDKLEEDELIQKSRPDDAHATEKLQHLCMSSIKENYSQGDSENYQSSNGHAAHELSHSLRQDLPSERFENDQEFCPSDELVDLGKDEVAIQDYVQPFVPEPVDDEILPSHLAVLPIPSDAALKDTLISETDSEFSFVHDEQDNPQRNACDGTNSKDNVFTESPVRSAVHSSKNSPESHSAIDDVALDEISSDCDGVSSAVADVPAVIETSSTIPDDIFSVRSEDIFQEGKLQRHQHVHPSPSVTFAEVAKLVDHADSVRLGVISDQNENVVPFGSVDYVQPSSKDSEDVSSHSLSSPVAIPGRNVVSFQPAAWVAGDDVSDAELEQFLSTLGETEGTSLSAELQLVSAENYFLVPNLASAEDSGTNPVLWNLDDLKESELRASPPLEMAPPIPMTLMDVTEFMDQELEVPPVATSLLSQGIKDLLKTSDEPDDESEGTSTSDEPLIQLSTTTTSSYDTDPGPPDYVSVAGNVGADDDEGAAQITAGVSGDENAAPSPVVIFSADNLGKIKPEWVPDEFAPICMLCGGRFGMVKRRHHCRACGSVICASCGNYRAKLEYLEMREDRVCALCNETFEYRNGGKQAEQLAVEQDPDANRSPSPMVVSTFNGPQPPGVLRRQDDPRRERRNVVFFDGIRPGGDLMEPAFHGNGRRMAIMNAKRQRRSPGAPPEALPPPKSRSIPKKSSANHVVKLFVHRDVLPVMELTRDGHYVIHETPDLSALREKFLACPSEPVDFYANLCLRITVQVIDLKCCMNFIVWSYATSGMRLVGQDEIIILLVKQDDDLLPPRDVFLHLNEIFLHAKQGHAIGSLGHSIVALGGYDQGFLGNRNNAGFLFIRQSFQCITSLRLPEPPYLFGVLMTKWEIPWAKMFPLRLMLRLGTEYRYYPCPLISFRNRKPVFEEVGHTVMNLLCDFRNFQYHLPCIEDTECCMEKGVITVKFPRHRYDQIVKLCQGSNEHVLAIGLGFSRRSDAHLVCVQNFENGQYETQAINIHSKGRKVTGTSFIIFNASLKGTEAFECRAAVVEDGIMAQINLRGLEELKSALKAMRNISFKAASKADDQTPTEQETIVVEWTNDGKTCNTGVRSIIDGKDLTGIESRRVSLKHSMDFLNGTLAIRCTEVFLTDEKDTGMVYREEIDVSRLAENLAMASCSVLRTHLYDYRDNGATKIALRVCLGPDTVEYAVGTKGELFPPQSLAEFDDKIMPLIYECARVWGVRPRLELELIFRVFQH